MDNPHDLYHPNNQTILNPATMPDTPIEPEEFVEKVVVQLASKSVLISKDMPELLEHMCRLFNFSIRPNIELPKTVRNLVFPAQTGTGKSVSVQVYVSMLENYSVIIVVAKVEEAIIGDEKDLNEGDQVQLTISQGKKGPEANQVLVLGNK
ncbi:cold shock domain-containing protein [Colwellia sp. MB02u-6]|uniref:cold shock domain-containing protein n=1 Tax=Colwellia sp. MB02u-6 TaxID=2759824 RepID=UPI0015F4BA76|nr:cold shock domain-containing protein [Colwellia sp. MB02u-6]MBA6327388.1 cold shock domain-containing protein [Colwellia sp. MB02u-6]